MAWQLEIHHLALDGDTSGDATFLAAWDTASKKARMALIDGGPAGSAESVATYLRQQVRRIGRLAGVGEPALNAVIASHYDPDHLDGITHLACCRPKLVKTATFFDQGPPGSGGSAGTTRYLEKVQALGATRPCRNLARSGAEGHGEQTDDLDFLVGRELLWWGATPPAGAPRLSCIAANNYVGKPGSTKSSTAAGVCDNQEDGACLALLLEFQGFCAYYGGDCPSYVESALVREVFRSGHTPVQLVRVSAHGGEGSTPPRFFDELGARVAVVSCSPGTSRAEPSPRVLDELLRSTTSLEGCYLTACAEQRPQVPATQGQNQLTQQAAAPKPAVIVAGLPGRPPGGAVIPSHIVVRTDAARAKSGHFDVIWFEPSPAKHDFVVDEYGAKRGLVRGGGA